MVAWADGREVWAEGACEGMLLVEPHGSGGFGYDPIFVPLGEPRTMAQLWFVEVMECLQVERLLALRKM